VSKACWLTARWAHCFDHELLVADPDDPSWLSLIETSQKWCADQQEFGILTGFEVLLETRKHGSCKMGADLRNHYFILIWSATPCAFPPPRPSIFSDDSFLVHRSVNQDDWHLLSHAMASDPTVT
jgi:hypothetical protein